jgi:CheY-like chemotaxis protein
VRSALQRGRPFTKAPGLKKVACTTRVLHGAGVAQVFPLWAAMALADPLHDGDVMERGAIPSRDSLSGFYALVVDSDKERRAVVSGVLRYCGALVTAAETTDAALTIMALLKPDVIVADFTRPEDGGLALVRSVRALEPEDGGMVAMIAVGDGLANGALARTRGYDAYLAKPLDPWELCRVIAGLLAP